MNNILFIKIYLQIIQRETLGSKYFLRESTQTPKQQQQQKPSGTLLAS